MLLYICQAPDVDQSAITLLRLETYGWRNKSWRARAGDWKHRAGDMNTYWRRNRTGDRARNRIEIWRAGDIGPFD
jgi:hypothetical protein